jgi:hypothetical protein
MACPFRPDRGGDREARHSGHLSPSLRSLPLEVGLLSARNVGVAVVVIVLMDVFSTNLFRKVGNELRTELCGPCSTGRLLPAPGAGRFRRWRISFPVLKNGTLLWSTSTCFPVRVLRPARAGRCFTENTPHPRISTRPPQARARPMLMVGHCANRPRRRDLVHTSPHVERHLCRVRRAGSLRRVGLRLRPASILDGSPLRYP